MTKRDLVISTLEAMGYRPMVDKDGDVMFRYQMKTLYVLGTQQDDSTYLVVLLPQFYEIEEGDEVKVLTVCNKLTRELKQTKIYIDQTLKDVSANCEFFYCEEACLRSQLEQSLGIIAMVRSTFNQTLKDFDEQ